MMPIFLLGNVFLTEFLILSKPYINKVKAFYNLATF